MKLNLDIKQYAHRFLRWWGAELLTFVPQNIKSMPAFQRNNAIIYMYKDRIVLEVSSNGSDHTSKFEISIVDGLKSEAVSNLLSYIEKYDISSVKIVISDELFFQDEFLINRSAKYKWQKIASLEVERRSPLLIENVIYGYRLKNNFDDATKVCVQWALVRLDSLTPLLQMLDDCKLRSYKAFAMDGDDCEIELKLPKKPIPFVTFFNGNVLQNALTAIFIALLLINIFTFNYLQSQRHDQMFSDVEVTRGPAMQSLDILNEIRVHRSIRESSAQAGNQYSLGHVLDELSAVLKDDVWIVEFRLDGDTVQISGFGDDPVRIAASLEERSMFSGVRVVNSSLIAGGKSQFNISFHRELATL